MNNLLISPLSKPWDIQYVTRGKEKIKFAVYRPSDQVSRFLVLINGRNEFIEKYSYVVDDLNLPDDCGLITWDHRGQGGSTGQTSHCETFDTYIDDAKAVLESANPHGLPYVILGHSMGGLVSVYGIIKGHLKPDFLLLSAPFLGMPEKPLPHFVARPLAETLVSMGLGNRYVRHKGALKKEVFLGNQKTHSRQMFERMKSSPYPAKSVTYAWVRAAFMTLDQVHLEENIRHFKTPTHIIAGDKETVVDLESIQTWIHKLQELNPGKQFELTVLRGAKHELLSEAKYYYDQTLVIIKNTLQEWLHPRSI